MRYGEIVFNMNAEVKPTGSASQFILKRWKKYSIYAKSGSHNRTDNISQNLYSTNSIYLYDYVAVSREWFHSVVHEDTVINTIPADRGSEVFPNSWRHNMNTFIGSPNATSNNYLLTYNALDSAIYMRNVYKLPSIQTDSGEYFEVVGGYPRNHLTHKRSLFSLFSTPTYDKVDGEIVNGYYKRCRQLISTTVGEDGLEDGSSPVQSTQVGNLNLIQGDNVINK